MEQCFVPLSVEIIPRNHGDFNTYLTKSARAYSGACVEVQFPDYGTVPWFPGSRIGSKKNRDFSTYLDKEREFSLAHVQRCTFLIMEQSFVRLAVEMVPGKHGDIRTYLAKRARTLPGACEEVQFPDYGTVLWSLGSRNSSRKAVRFQNLSFQVTESSVSSMCRGVVS
jgi:hypothetical protein